MAAPRTICTRACAGESYQRDTLVGWGYVAASLLLAMIVVLTGAPSYELGSQQAVVALLFSWVFVAPLGFLLVKYNEMEPSHRHALGLSAFMWAYLVVFSLLLVTTVCFLLFGSDSNTWVVSSLLALVWLWTWLAPIARFFERDGARYW